MSLVSKYQVRGYEKDMAVYIRTFTDLDYAYKKYEEIKRSGEFWQFELDDITDENWPEMIEHEFLDEIESDSESEPYLCDGGCGSVVLPPDDDEDDSVCDHCRDYSFAEVLYYPYYLEKLHLNIWMGRIGKKGKPGVYARKMTRMEEEGEQKKKEEKDDKKEN